MSQWKKKWSPDKKIKKKQNEPLKQENSEIKFIKQKMNTIRKRENPKNIPIFENIYEPPKSSIIEGMSNDLEDTNSKEESNIGTTIKEGTQAVGQNLMNSLGKVNQNPIAKLENQLSSSIDNLSGLSELSNLGDTFKDLDLLNIDEFGDTAKNISSMFKIDVKGIEKVINKITGSMRSLSGVIGSVSRQLAERIHQIKIYIQLFILRINKIIDDTLTKIANALTQNTATEKEIKIFKDQSQKMTTMMLVWYFVYNWYYIIFFLEKEDEILYEFDGNKLKDYNTYLYGAIGPAYRVIESFNWCILKIGLLKKYVPTPVIMILLFFVFFILVSGNFQGSLLMNFFNAMQIGRAHV